MNTYYYVFSKEGDYIKKVHSIYSLTVSDRVKGNLLTIGFTFFRWENLGGGYEWYEIPENEITNKCKAALLLLKD